MTCKRLKIGLFNAGSLGTNHDNFIASITRHDIDVIAINETWLREGEEHRAPVLPEYKLRHIPRPRELRSRGGGVGFYLRASIGARIWPHPVDPAHKSVEQMWITVSLSGKKLLIGTAYRPPWLDVDLFLDAISDSINSNVSFDNIVILGDFNINFDNKSDPKTEKFITFLACSNLTQIISAPTHFTASSQTIIDVVCTNLTARTIAVEPIGSILGHSLIVCEFNIKREKASPRTFSYRPINNICSEVFDRDLQAIPWDYMLTLGDVNDVVNAFNQCVVALFDHHAPTKTVTVKDRPPPWLTDNIKFMMRLRDRVGAEYRKNKLHNKEAYYKSLKSLVKRSLYFEKSAYFNQYINNNLNDPKNLWKNLKNTCLPENTKELPVHFNDPNIINSHFLNIPGTFDVSLSLLTYFEYHKFGHETFHINPVNLNSLIKIIRSIKSNAMGSDLIDLRMLLMTFPYSLNVIMHIINLSISTSTFPESWKLAIVRPLPKISNPVGLNDLRPISILPCLSKIIEKVVCSQLTEFLEKNKILPDLQSGFRKGRGTSTALLEVTDNILSAQDKGMCTILVLLDFSRAFDSININLLLAKLSYYGFDREAVLWFHSYLSDRCQFVKLDQTNGTAQSSKTLPVSRGVPQGSILGPILFIMYAADLAEHIKHCKFHFYADDTQIYFSFKPSDVDDAIVKLNEDLARIALWSKNNMLLLNPIKTKFLIFGTKNQLVNLDPFEKVMLMGKPIERVFEARNLGLLVDCNLRFEKHVANSVKTCFYKLKLLYKIRPFINEAVRTQLVEALVLSRLNYADVVFGPRLLNRTKRLIQRIQNACARFCFCIPLRAHVTPYLNKHSILKMMHRHKLHLASLLFGVINQKAPLYLYEKLSWVTSRRQVSSRVCSIQLATERHRTAAFRGSFRYAASRCWNNIPPPIRSLQSAPLFKIKLKTFLFQHQDAQGTMQLDTSAI